MSKMDNLRAMREARYAEMTKRSAGSGPATGAAPKKRHPVAPPASAATSATASAKSSSAESPAESPNADAVTSPALCGHRNMSGRTCTREQGHAAKSHRYS